MTTRRPRTALPLVAAVLFAATASSHAAELVSFDMSIIVGADTDKAVAASFVADGITTTHLLKNNLLDGSGASPNTYPYSGNIATTWATISAQPSLDVATTLENANYFHHHAAPRPKHHPRIAHLRCRRQRHQSPLVLRALQRDRLRRRSRAPL